jgi:hypothetical protein
MIIGNKRERGTCPVRETERETMLETQTESSERKKQEI